MGDDPLEPVFTRLASGSADDSSGSRRNRVSLTTLQYIDGPLNDIQSSIDSPPPFTTGMWLSIKDTVAILGLVNIVLPKDQESME